MGFHGLSKREDPICGMFFLLEVKGSLILALEQNPWKYFTVLSSRSSVSESALICLFQGSAFNF